MIKNGEGCERGLNGFVTLIQSITPAGAMPIEK